MIPKDKERNDLCRNESKTRLTEAAKGGIMAGTSGMVPILICSVQ